MGGAVKNIDESVQERLFALVKRTKSSGGRPDDISTEVVQRIAAEHGLDTQTVQEMLGEIVERVF